MSIEELFVPGVIAVMSLFAVVLAGAALLTRDVKSGPKSESAGK